MRSCPRQLAARLPPPRLPTSALAGPALAVLKVMKDAGQSNTPKTARWGRLSGLVDVRFGSKADIRRRLNDVRFTPEKRTFGGSNWMPASGNSFAGSLFSQPTCYAGQEFNRGKAMRKSWISAALAPALALMAGPLWALQRAPTTVVACSGTFAKDSSHLELATAFNSKNITFTDVESGDGSKIPASILFPNDPKRRLEVWWSDRTH